VSGLAASLRKEWLEQWRSYRMLIATIVLSLLGLMAPLTARFTPELMKRLPNGAAIARLLPTPTAMDAVTQYLKNISQLGLVLALLLTMGTVAREKETGTAAMMLVKPLSRGSFLAAKFIVLAGTFAIGIAIAAAGAWYYTRLLFGPLDVARWAALNALALAFIVVQIAITLFASVITRSQAAAGGLAFGGLLLLAVLGSLPGIGGYVPGRLLAWAATIMTGHPAAAWPALGTSVAIVAAALIGARASFERQEL
jgi:ABC-2 type transport system permease protein